MSSKVSPNNIPSMSEDWGNDSRNGLPYSGGAVQRFIKNRISEKTGDFYFDSTSFILYGFGSTEDKETWRNDPSRTDLIISSTPISFSSNMYRILRDNHGGLNINTTTNQKNVPITIDFDVQTKLVTDTAWQSTGQGCYFTLYVDRGVSGTYIQIGERTLLSAGTTYSVNVRDYIMAGSNRVKVVMVAEDDDTIVANDIYTIQMSEIYIEEFNNGWYNAIVEDDPAKTNYKLGGFKIVGSLQKTLYIEIYQENERFLRFEKLIGTASYVDTPYYFQGEDLDLSSLSTGIYVVKAWVASGSLESTPITYNIMYVAEGESTTAQLVCVNNVAEKVYNYSTATLCQYAVYAGGFTTGSPHIVIRLWTGSTPTTKVDKDYVDTATGVAHNLEYTIEWLVEATINLNISFEITIGDCSQGKPDIPIDNSAVYPAETGMSFYLNASSRSNTDSDRESVLNEATSIATPLVCTWTDMAWVDGIDGWTADDDGRKCLKISAGSKVEIPYKPMSGENMAFEICFKTQNVSDYLENIITAATNPTDDDFQGIRIRPTEIVVHSSADTGSQDDYLRGVSFNDEETQHLVVVIQREFDGNPGRNLVTGYVNGCKNFQFKYDSGTAWENTANLIIGSSSADVFVYFCRIYNTKTLGVKAVEQNYINSLPTLEERRIAYEYFNSILNSNTHELGYQYVSNSDYGYNFFVVEMTSPTDKGVPSRANGWNSDLTGVSNFEMHFGKHPLWDFKLFGVETSGQGTTSMNYYRWNLRFRIDKSNSDKKIDVAYYNEPTKDLSGNKVYNIQKAVSSKSVKFDGGANGTVQKHPEVMRITAKTNFASSMQSHKIGATMAFNELHKALELYNEAESIAIASGAPEPCVAVYEYPAFGFEKKTSAQGVVTYEFIGLFTIGPDKGDKPTFGYNMDEIKNSLITLEGSDHDRFLVKFSHPWNSAVKFSSTKGMEALVLDDGQTLEKGWEVSNCHGLSPDKAVDEASIKEVLDSEFKLAYEVAYNNSTMIFPVLLSDPDWGGDSADEVLANINANVSGFRAQRLNSRFSKDSYEFWIEGQYILYHYDYVTKLFVAGVNLIDDCGAPTGTTVAEKNEFFKSARRTRFKANAENYWDIQDTLYQMDFLIINGGTDNFGKNTYPYLMKLRSQGGRWKWRQDDLDTLFGINNSGFQKNKYSIEFEDAVDGNIVFAGSNSVFWNLIFECYWDDYGTSMGLKSMGKAMLEKMAQLGGGTNVFNGCINFVKKCFWDNAQDYFPKSAYNIDANFKYERAWLSNGQSVNPLAQSLGDHYQAERLWVINRIIYTMSLFGVGPFGDYSDSSLGVIQFRPQSLPSITITPMMDMYPSVISGAKGVQATGRTSEGTARTFVGPFGTDGETQITIQSANYLRSLGNLKDLPISRNYLGDGLTITGAKLEELTMGDEDPTKVTTNVQKVTFTNTKCIKKIDARNTSSLTGPFDVSVCTRLRELYLNGSNVTQVTLPNGSKIKSLVLGDSTNGLFLKNLKFLENLQLPDDISQIRTLQVEKCTYQNAFSILRQLYNSDDSAMQYIRVVWDGVEDGNSSDISMLANIAQDLKKDGSEIEYKGITAQGYIDGKPVIEGSIETDGIYSSDLDKMGCGSPEDYGEGKKRALASVFGTLYIIYDPNRVYIEFEDSLVGEKCVSFYAGGEEGLSVEKASKATKIYGATNTTANDYFKGTAIEYFNEFKYFTSIPNLGITSGGNGAFVNCSSLKEITLPSQIKVIAVNAFLNCYALNKINLEGVTHIYSSFVNCRSLTELYLPNLQYLGGQSFFGCTGLKKVRNLGEITIIGNGSANWSGTWHFYGAFDGCTSLEEVTLPNTLTNIGTGTFYGCTALKTINGGSRVLTISTAAFYRTALTSLGELGTLVQTIQGEGFRLAHLPESINLPYCSSISSRAFMSTTGIKTIVIGGSMVTLGSDSDISWASASGYGGVFESSSVKNITLPSSLSIIGAGSFVSCNLTSLSIPTTISKIRSNAFRGTTCENKITIGNTLTYIGGAAFKGFNGSLDIDFTNVETIGDGAFINCKGLKKVNSNKVVAIYAGSRSSDPTAVFQGCSDLEEVNFPMLERISGGSWDYPGGAFVGCSSLMVAKFGVITTIGPSDFKGCSNLRFLSGYEGITSLSTCPFYGTSRLHQFLRFPNCTSATGGMSSTVGTFYGSGIMGLYMPEVPSLPTYRENYGGFAKGSSFLRFAIFKKITSFGTSAFQDCSSLEYLIIDRDTSGDTEAVVATYGGSALKNTSKLKKIAVAESLVDSYKSASGWSDFSSKIVGVTEVTELPETYEGSNILRCGEYYYDWNGESFDLINGEYEMKKAIVHGGNPGNTPINTDIQIGSNTIEIKISGGDIWGSSGNILKLDGGSVLLAPSGNFNNRVSNGGTENYPTNSGRVGTWRWDIDGVTYTTLDGEVTTYAYPRTQSTNKLIVGPGFGKIEYLKVWDYNGNLVNELLPMMFNGELGLFDRTKNKFYKPSSGTITAINF